MDPQTAAFAITFQTFLEAMNTAAAGGVGGLTPLGERVQDFLGVELNTVDPTTETFPAHQVVDLDLALDSMVTTYDGQRLGVSGINRAHMDSLGDYLVHAHWPFDVGPVSYQRRPTGPATDRRVVAFALVLMRVDGVPLVFLQRAANRQYGRENYTLEILCPRDQTTEAFLTELRELMSAKSVLRGQVISFQPDDFDYHSPGSEITFLNRPHVTADQVILPDGLLDRVARHVVGIGEQREALTAAGQHLKRGVLLYGPPGTGKTHLVRHLLTRTEGTTAVLLSGRTLGLLTMATKLARAVQPAIIVMEDCDLVAEERGGSTNAALFETLEAMDGLDSDADITFILTTNRPDLLERALVERPGRVDLAVQIDRPDQAGRRQLLDLYARELQTLGWVSAEAVDLAAERTEGVTASFAKELVRRCVVDAAQEHRDPTDADLLDALEEMLSDAGTLTRTLLGGQGWAPDGLAAGLDADDPNDPDKPRDLGWTRPAPRPGLDPRSRP